MNWHGERFTKSGLRLRRVDNNSVHVDHLETHRFKQQFVDFFKRKEVSPKINVVMVPGGPGMGSEYLESLAVCLDKGFDVYLVDLPGNGGVEIVSPEPSGQKSVDCFENTSEKDRRIQEPQITLSKESDLEEELWGVKDPVLFKEGFFKSLRLAEELFHPLKKLYNKDGNDKSYDQLRDLYLSWPKVLEEVFDLLDHVVLLGHSFGGMLVQSNKALEDKALGLVLMNTAPTNIFTDKSFFSNPEDKAHFLKTYEDLWSKQGYKTPFEHLTEAVQGQGNILKRQSDDAYKESMVRLAPFYFTPQSLEKGKHILEHTNYSYKARDILLFEFVAHFKTAYVPSKPTLIITSDQDVLTPEHYMKTYPAYQNLNNIQFTSIHHANHFSWIDNPEDVSKTLNAWLLRFKETSL